MGFSEGDRARGRIAVDQARGRGDDSGNQQKGTEEEPGGILRACWHQEAGSFAFSGTGNASEELYIISSRFVRGA